MQLSVQRMCLRFCRTALPLRVVEGGLLAVVVATMSPPRRVELGGEVPAAGVALAVVAVADVAVAQRGDLLGGVADVGPGVGGLFGSSPALVNSLRL